ncbi:hypothetical protein [Nonomuraea sp. 10N515B]|uniref:hypothetical protein n=1 Tax=Nonomuraea sp. 10N515B TaxID=3457422 RepID=UPI003FCE73C8
MSEGVGTPDRRQVDKSTAEGRKPMADSHERRIQRMVTAITDTINVLQMVLADLPIPVQLDLIGLNPSQLGERMERTRQIIREIPMPDGAKAHLELAILDFLSAFDVAHIAYHEEENLWREDAVFALISDVLANITLVNAYLHGVIDDTEED